VTWEFSGDRVKAGQMSLVGVRLAQPDQPGVSVELEDRAQRVRLVDAHHVEQRRIGEGYGRDRDLGDPARRCHRAGLTARTGTSS
jgi:hypothetical protein